MQSSWKRCTRYSKNAASRCLPKVRCGISIVAVSEGGRGPVYYESNLSPTVIRGGNG